jgi:hypothetical protein
MYRPGQNINDLSGMIGDISIIRCLGSFLHGFSTISLKLADWTWHFMIKYMKMTEELDKRSDMILLDTVLKTAEEFGDNDMKVSLSGKNSFATIVARFR